MYSKITQLRYRGVRRSDGDIANDAGACGAIMLVRAGAHIRMDVQAWGVTNQSGRLLPSLWDARCITWHAGLMLWQGFQHAALGEQQGSPVYFQEWRVELLSPAAPVDAIKSPFFARNSNL